MKGITTKHSKRKVLPFLLVLLLSMGIVFAEDFSLYTFKVTSTNENIKQTVFGDITMIPSKVDWVCTSTAGLIPNRLTDENGNSYYVPSCPRSRSAPQGNFIQQCVCTRVSADGSGRCIAEDCDTITNEANNPSCWLLTSNQGVLQYDTPIEINPYIKTKYMTDARVWYDSDNNCAIDYADYNMDTYVDVNVKEGLKIQLENITFSNQVQYFKIKYINNLGTAIEGAIEVKQTTFMFLPASTVEIMPLTFQKGENEITYQMNSIYGKKDITVTPYVIIKEEDTSGNVLRSFNLVGDEVVTTTQTIQDRGILNPAQYEPVNAQKAIIMPVDYRPIGIGLLIMSLLVAGAITVVSLTKRKR